MKKKRLERFTLSELAQEMPIVSEEEQQNCVGGALVYGLGISSAHEFVGSSYMPDDPSSVFFIRPDSVTYISYGGDGGYDEGGGYGSIPVYTYSSAPMSAQQAGFDERGWIMESLANSYGVYNIETGYDPNKNTFGGTYANGTIYLNTNSYHFDRLNGNVNCYDILLTIVHELHHLATPWDTGQDISELEAYQAMKNHPFYTLSSIANQLFIDASILCLQDKINNGN